MAIINTYPTATPKGADLLIGTQVKDDTVTENSTKSFTVDAIKSFIAGTNIVKKKVNLTSTDLLSLNSNGVFKLVDAPGADKTILVISAAYKFTFGTAAYNFSDNIGITTGTGDAQFEIPSNVMNGGSQGAISYEIALPQDGQSMEANSALNLYTNQQSVTQGNGTVSLTVFYTIVDFS